MSKPATLPPGPWEFRDFGGGLELFAAHGGRPVVLGTCRVRGDLGYVVLGVKGEGGEGVRPLRPDDPIALAIAAIPDSIARGDALVSCLHDFIAYAELDYEAERVGSNLWTQIAVAREVIREYQAAKKAPEVKRE